MQVSGYLIEDGITVPDVEISGAWDQELLVKKSDGKKQTLWKYKEPAFLDTRYTLLLRLFKSANQSP